MSSKAFRKEKDQPKININLLPYHQILKEIALDFPPLFVLFYKIATSKSPKEIITNNIKAFHRSEGWYKAVIKLADFKLINVRTPKKHLHEIRADLVSITNFGKRVIKKLKDTEFLQCIRELSENYYETEEAFISAFEMRVDLPSLEEKRSHVFSSDESIKFKSDDDIPNEIIISYKKIIDSTGEKHIKIKKVTGEVICKKCENPLVINVNPKTYKRYRRKRNSLVRTCNHCKPLKTRRIKYIIDLRDEEITSKEFLSDNDLFKIAEHSDKSNITLSDEERLKLKELRKKRQKLEDQIRKESIAKRIHEDAPIENKSDTLSPVRERVERKDLSITTSNKQSPTIKMRIHKKTPSEARTRSSLGTNIGEESIDRKEETITISKPPPKPEMKEESSLGEEFIARSLERAIRQAKISARMCGSLRLEEEPIINTAYKILVQALNERNNYSDEFTKKVESLFKIEVSKYTSRIKEEEDNLYARYIKDPESYILRDNSSRYKKDEFTFGNETNSSSQQNTTQKQITEENNKRNIKNYTEMILSPLRTISRCFNTLKSMSHRQLKFHLIMILLIMGIQTVILLSILPYIGEYIHLIWVLLIPFYASPILCYLIYVCRG